MQHKSISSFRGTYFFLSNFYLVDIGYEGLVYPSVENAFQASKTKVKKLRKVFTRFTPAQSKLHGRSLDMYSNWPDERVAIMRRLIKIKFQDPDLRDKLLATGEAELIEGNTWGDVFWGKCQGRGLNRLGKILMDVRTTLACPLEY